jgi:hypothetical protein
MRVTLFTVGVAEMDEDDLFHGSPVELQEALREYCNEQGLTKEFVVDYVFHRDEDIEEPEDGCDEKAVKAWKENGLGACIDIVADYKEGRIR